MTDRPTPRYLAHVAKTPRARPGDFPGAISVVISAEDLRPIGIAFEVGYLGGFRLGEDRGPIESVWNLVIGKEPVEGRFALRMGYFVELSEEAE